MMQLKLQSVGIKLGLIYGSEFEKNGLAFMYTKDDVI